MKTFLLASLFLPFFAIGQARTGNLNIFSEDGDLFFLVLNGQPQNREPQNNIRVEDLPSPVYNARIIFVDSDRKPIVKTLQVADTDNKMMDVTYRLRRDKTGTVKLQPYSAVDVKRQYRVPAGMYVCRYGQKDNSRLSRKATHTAVPQAINEMPTSAESSTDIPTGQVIPEENFTQAKNHLPSVSSANNCRGRAMKSADLNLAIETVMASDFEDAKVSTAKAIVSGNCLSCEQVTALCKLFGLEESRLEFAKYAFPYIIDPKNYLKLNNALACDSSRQELNKFAANK